MTLYYLMNQLKSLFYKMLLHQLNYSQHTLNFRLMSYCLIFYSKENSERKSLKTPKQRKLIYMFYSLNKFNFLTQNVFFSKTNNSKLIKIKAIAINH